MTRERPHVLVVEDNALVTSATQILLEDAGFQVSSAASVTDAYVSCQRDPPDAILLDLRLPDADGLTLLTKLHAAGGRVPVVVALTGRDEREVRERCLRAGCIDVLMKPVDTRALAPRIRAWLETGAQTP